MGELKLFQQQEKIFEVLTWDHSDTFVASCGKKLLFKKIKDEPKIIRKYLSLDRNSREIISRFA